MKKLLVGITLLGNLLLARMRISLWTKFPWRFDSNEIWGEMGGENDVPVFLMIPAKTCSSLFFCRLYSRSLLQAEKTVRTCILYEIHIKKKVPRTENSKRHVMKQGLIHKVGSGKTTA